MRCVPIVSCYVNPSVKTDIPREDFKFLSSKIYHYTIKIMSGKLYYIIKNRNIVFHISEQDFFKLFTIDEKETQKICQTCLYYDEYNCTCTMKESCNYKKPVNNFIHRCKCWKQGYIEYEKFCNNCNRKTYCKTYNDCIKNKDFSESRKCEYWENIHEYHGVVVTKNILLSYRYSTYYNPDVYKEGFYIPSAASFVSSDYLDNHKNSNEIYSLDEIRTFEVLLNDKNH